MQQENNLNYIFLDEAPVDYREKIEKYAYHWKWFVLAIIIALLSAYAYLRYTPNIYEVSSTILIEGDSKGGLPSELSAFEDLGLGLGAPTTFENEIELLKSYSLMTRVVKELGINVTYYSEESFRTSELFLKTVPIKINFFNKDAAFYNRDTLFVVQVKTKTNFSLINSEGDVQSEHVFGENIVTDFGELTITPNNLGDIEEGTEIIVNISPLKNVVNSYLNRIQISEVTKKASVIKLTLSDRVKLKAQTIVNNLVEQYNRDAVEDKSLIGEKTGQFINNRLEIINKDLLRVEVGVEDFKTKNNLTDIISEATLGIETKSELDKRIIGLSTQLKLVAYVQDYLKTNTEDLIPANLGLMEGGLEGSTLKYNELLLERNRILQSSSETNPVIVNLNNQINNLRGSITQSLINLTSSLTISLNQLQQQETGLSSKLSSVPKQEREFRNMSRQQQIIETLYLYLLEKREENAISLAVTIPNAKIIDIAYGSDLPIAPKRKIVYLVAGMLGLLIPFIVLYILFLLDNKVHSRKDVEAVLKAPVLGDIPKNTKDRIIVVEENDRDGVAESFRLLRTNMNFMLSNVKEGGKAIFIGSTIGGEGKTFISMNLATVLALSNKKVLLLGADIRKPRLLEYLDISAEKGITHYLMDRSLNPADIIEHVTGTNFDIMHSGIIAPNPSELLMNGRFDELINFGKENYDYVIVDTAPLQMVTDTLLMSSSADLFMYVVRANYLDKRLLETPKKLYEEKRLPNMAVLVNGLDTKRGYGYGYGYGYGQEALKKPWWQRFFKK